MLYVYMASETWHPVSWIRCNRWHFFTSCDWDKVLTNEKMLSASKSIASTTPLCLETESTTAHQTFPTKATCVLFENRLLLFFLFANTLFRMSRLRCAVVETANNFKPLLLLLLCVLIAHLYRFTWRRHQHIVDCDPWSHSSRTWQVTENPIYHKVYNLQ
jgi:hypothetical protein